MSPVLESINATRKTFDKDLRLYISTSWKRQVGLQEYSKIFNRSRAFFFFFLHSFGELVVRRFVVFSSSGVKVGLVHSFYEPEVLWGVKDWSTSRWRLHEKGL
ncbi:hypothetical protein ISCGN_018990 [Ixodes scapularis]